MSKNKLIWSVVLSLIVLLALPIAYAQTFTGSRVFFILVNAAVIGIVLFILQAFLIPNKPDKEKVSVWVIVILASLLLAYFFGQDGFIWQVGPVGAFLSTYKWYIVLGNTALITAFLYFLLGLLKVNEKLGLGSTEGKTGYAILLFIISSILAVKLINPSLPVAQQWIWAQPTISTLIAYFFGRYGILTTNENRIFIFIGTAALFATFFDYIGLGKENRKLNYILAIIFAANLVSGPNPYSYADIKPMILIIGTWILGGNLSGQFTVGKYKIIGYIIAFLLMMWAVSSVETVVTPAGQQAVAQGGGGVTGWIGGFFSILFSSKAIWILAAIILFLFFVISRGENKALLKDIRERYGRIIWNRIKMSADSGLLRWVPFLSDDWNKRETPKGMLPPIILENLHIFHYLMGYMKRIFIFASKWKQVRDANSIIGKAIGGLGNYKIEHVLINQIKAYRTGGEVYNVDSKGNKIQSEEIEGGLFGSYEELIKLINKTMEITDIQLTEAITGEGVMKGGKIPSERAEYLKALASQISIYTGRISNYYEQLNEIVQVYGYNHIIKGWMYLVLDQVNPSGAKYPHPYFFVPKGTPLKYADGRDAGVTTEELTEVDIFGRLMEDIFKNIHRFADTKDPTGADAGELSPEAVYSPPRRVKDTRSVIAHPDPYKVTQLVDVEWQGFMFDLKYGAYHPYSKSFNDYERFLKKRIEFFDDEFMMRNSHLPSKKDTNNPAFDREALKNPGQMLYWGRKRYSDDLSGIEDKNPYPTLSSYGMTLYLLELTEKDMANKAEAHKWQSIFLGDTGEWSTIPKEAKKAVGLLSAVKKKGPH